MPDKLEQARKISSKIKQLRDELGWNQAKLANEAKITAAALSKIEKGDGRVPTIVVLRKIATALNVAPYELTGEAPVELSESDQRTRAFYRKWDVLDGLTKEDEDMLMGMAERLKQITDDD